MGYKKFRIIAVAAALLVVTAFFVLLLKFFGDTGRVKEQTPSVTEKASESSEAAPEYSGLKEAGVETAGAFEAADSHEKRKKADDSDWPYLEILLSSVNRDIKVMITDRKGNLISGVPFRTEISRGEWIAEYRDSDCDGVITAAELPGGKYTVHLKPQEGFIAPETDSTVTVRSDISYTAVDYIRTIIKTEDEIDAAIEDTANIEEEDDGALLEAGEIDLASGTIGIDVSKYNKDIDWEKVKSSGIEYAIIRLGYRGSSTGSLVEDPYFERNLKGAREAGLKIGVYFFTQALNETEAVEEASMVESLVSASDLSLPVFLDVESAGGRADVMDRGVRTANIKAFIETLENAGYRAGVYANKKWLTTYINADELSEYPIWLAQYKVKRPTYEGKYDAWQYSSKGRVDGIEGNVDLDVILKS